MVKTDGFDVKRLAWGRFQLEKPLKSRFKPVFIHNLYLQTNGHIVSSYQNRSILIGI